MPPKREIEEKLQKMGDYVKIDYLTRVLKENLELETRKFVLLKLAEIYATKSMFLESGRLMRLGADINTSFQSKINDFIKSAEMYMRANEFYESDISYNKAVACANEAQKAAIKLARKGAYKKYAGECLVKDKRKNAADALQKYLSLDLDPIEKKKAQDELLNLYEKLGKIREFYDLKRMM